MQETMIHLQQLYRIGQHASSGIKGIKGIKCTLEILGISSACMAEPFHAFNPPEKQAVASLFDEQREDPLLVNDFTSYNPQNQGGPGFQPEPLA